MKRRLLAFTLLLTAGHVFAADTYHTPKEAQELAQLGTQVKSMTGCEISSSVIGIETATGATDQINAWLKCPDGQVRVAVAKRGQPLKIVNCAPPYRDPNAEYCPHNPKVIAKFRKREQDKQDLAQWSSQVKAQSNCEATGMENQTISNDGVIAQTRLQLSCPNDQHRVAIIDKGQPLKIEDCSSPDIVPGADSMCP